MSLQSDTLSAGLALWQSATSNATLTVDTGSTSDTGVTATQKDLAHVNGGDRLDEQTCTFVVLSGDLNATPIGGDTTVNDGDSKLWNVDQVDRLGGGGWALRCSRRVQRGTS